MGKMKEALIDLVCAIDDGAEYIDLFMLFPNASKVDIYEAWVSVHGEPDDVY